MSVLCPYQPMKVVSCPLLADAFNAEVVCVRNEEGAAFGAALQAIWAYRRSQGEMVRIEELTDRYVTLDESTRTKPDPARVALYRQMQLRNKLVRDLSEAFILHRQLITG